MLQGQQLNNAINTANFNPLLNSLTAIPNYNNNLLNLSQLQNLGQLPVLIRIKILLIIIINKLKLITIKI